MSSRSAGFRVGSCRPCLAIGHCSSRRPINIGDEAAGAVLDFPLGSRECVWVRVREWAPLACASWLSTADGGRWRPLGADGGRPASIGGQCPPLLSARPFASAFARRSSRGRVASSRTPGNGQRDHAPDIGPRARRAIEPRPSLCRMHQARRPSGRQLNVQGIADRGIPSLVGDGPYEFHVPIHVGARHPSRCVSRRNFGCVVNPTRAIRESFPSASCGRASLICADALPATPERFGAPAANHAAILSRDQRNERPIETGIGKRPVASRRLSVRVVDPREPRPARQATRRAARARTRPRPGGADDAAPPGVGQLSARSSTAPNE